MINANFIGRLGADSELKTSQSGNNYVSFRAATDTFVKGQSVTEWISVSYIGPRAEKMREFLKKGNLVYVQGTLRSNVYTNRQGETVASYDMIADRVEFVRTGQKQDENKQTDEPFGQNIDVNAFKQPQAVSTPTPTPQMSMAAAVATQNSNDDDLPF